MKGNVVQMPGSREVKLDASLPPADIRPDFDLIRELEVNYGRYASGRAWIGLRSFPDDTKMHLDALRARVVATHNPGLSPTAACCIDYGTGLLRSNPDIRSLIKSRKSFDTKDWEDGDAQSVVLSFLDSLSLDVTVSGSSSQRRFSIPSTLRVLLYDLADGIGISYSSAIMISLMMTLSSQPAIHLDHRKAMEEIVSHFFKRVRWRAEGVKALMEVLK